MSQQNIEVVRSAFAAWNARDMETFADLHGRDIMIMRFIEGWPEPAPVVGQDAVMRYYDAQRPWQDDTAEPITDFLAAGDRVVVRFLWRSASSGAEVGMEVTGVYTVRKGKILVVEYFRDHAAALEAIGLSQ